MNFITLESKTDTFYYRDIYLVLDENKEKVGLSYIMWTYNQKFEDDKTLSDLLKDFSPNIIRAATLANEWDSEGNWSKGYLSPSARYANSTMGAGIVLKVYRKKMDIIIKYAALPYQRTAGNNIQINIKKLVLMKIIILKMTIISFLRMQIFIQLMQT